MDDTTQIVLSEVRELKGEMRELRKGGTAADATAAASAASASAWIPQWRQN